MASDGLEMQVNGVSSTIRAFDELSVASRRRIMRPALRAGAQVVLRAAKADIGPGTFKDSSGATRRSLGIKVGLGKKGVFAVVGARNRQGDRVHNGRLRRPIRYLHLINRWLPFIEAALDENVGQIETTIRKRAKIELEKEVRKLAAKQAAKAARA